MSQGSRFPGFYKLSIDERRERVCQAAGLEPAELNEALTSGGLDPDTADKVVENVLGIYGLPFGVALNVRVNGTDRLAPMVVEEPSVIAAASNAAKMIRAGGGFEAQMVEDLMISQVQLYDVPDRIAAVRKLEAHRKELLELAATAAGGLIARGGGPREIEVRDLGEGCVVVHLLVDCRDAMGANLVNGMAEQIGPRAAELAQGKLGLRILSNLCDRRRVHVRCRVHSKALTLSRGGRVVVAGEQVLDGIVQASRFAELDPYRAATHNKGIMNGVDAVVLATGNDFRAVEAGAHAYAARSGRYAPLAVWRRDGEDLIGELEMPLALGIVGGTLRVHPVARMALGLMRVASAAELSQIAASVGLASNLAALRALATEGIQRGHMSLHARSVAIAAGASGDEVEVVAQTIATAGQINVDAAEQALARIRQA
ncbi:MAG: hydroxymethylglutaryl-CoA reductase, degradative [Polyangiaceae bacterium]